MQSDLLALESGLVRMLYEAPRSEAIGAALSFLLYCAGDGRLQRALNTPVDHRATLIDVLRKAARGTYV